MHLASFLTVSAVLIAVPGPDMALVARNALLGGRRAAIGTALGVGLGLAIWTLTASAGVAALLSESEPAFLALKIVGATYLVWLGLQALVAARRRVDREASSRRSTSHARPSHALRQGLVSNLGNPKIAVFFTSFLPQFAGSGASFLALLALGLAFCAMTVLWLLGYGAVVVKAGDVLRLPRVKRTLDSITGTVLIAFGVRLAAEHR